MADVRQMNFGVSLAHDSSLRCFAATVRGNVGIGNACFVILNLI
jgi:hypothetical protein